MVTLVSPGVSVTVIDESFYVSAGQGTVPLFFVATAQDKLQQDGVTLAAATAQENANKLLLMTSQRDVLQSFGTPIFREDSGSVLQGDELNEYGLHGLYSYMGIANRAYVIRSDLDLNQMAETTVEPAGDPTHGTYWFDTDDTSYGLFKSNGNPNPGLAWDRIIPVFPTASQITSGVPNPSFGSVGDFAIVTQNTLNMVYEKSTAGIWNRVGTINEDAGGAPNAWIQNYPTTIQSVMAPDGTYDYVADTEGVLADDLEIGDTIIFTIDNGSPLTATITDAGGGEATPTSVAANIDALTGITASVVNGRIIILSTNGGDVVVANGSGTAATALEIEGSYPGVKLAYAPHTSVPNLPANSVWLKTTNPNFGANYNVKIWNAQNRTWDNVQAPLYSDALAAEIGYAGTILPGNLYVQYNTAANGAGALANENFVLSSSILRYGTNAAVMVNGDEANPTLTNGHEILVRTINTDNLPYSTQTYTVTLSGTTAFAFVTSFQNADIPNMEAEIFMVGADSYVRISNTAGYAFELIEEDTILDDLGIEPGIYSNWSLLTYEASDVAPRGSIVDGTLWFNNDFFVDIMVNDGDEWCGLQSAKGQLQLGASAVEVQLTSAMPSFKSDGATPLENGDLWINTDDTENYPVLYRYSTVGGWQLVDTTDQTTPLGIVFSDARASDALGSTTIEDLYVSDYVDPDAPDPRTYPAGMLLWNTRASTNNVKRYDSNALTAFPNSYEVGNSVTFTKATVNSSSNGRWVTASGNRTDGSPYMGRHAQRRMVVNAIASTIVNNEDIRSESVFFNLMAAPGYFEVYDELVTLGIDRKETVFIVTDVPARLPPNGTAIQTWATNANNAPSNGEEGRITRYTYSAQYYPWGLGTNVDGLEVMIPSSTIAMRTYAYNDSVSYLWYPPAGLRRGVVNNATSVGFLNAEQEYTPILLNTGLADVLYLNNINPIRFFPDRGLLVWGDKTLHNAENALDRVNVARLIVYMRYQLDRLAMPFIFELNTRTTRQSFKETVDRFLADLVNQQALIDFATICNESNNTPERIDRNELWCDIAAKPSRSINFVYLPIRILNTGDDFPS